MRTYKRLLVILLAVVATIILIAVVYRLHRAQSGSGSPQVASPGESAAPQQTTHGAPGAEAEAHAAGPGGRAATPPLPDLAIPMTKAVASMVSKVTGNPTDLSPQEEARAMEVWRMWQARWGRFRGLSGKINIQYFDKDGATTFSTDAIIAVHTPDLTTTEEDWDSGRFPSNYTMTISDPAGKWSYAFDWKTGGTLTCDDAALAKELKTRVNGNIGATIWHQTFNAVNPREAEKPAGRYKNEVGWFVSHQPMKNLEAPGVPDSCIFAPSPGWGGRGVYRFEEGNLVSIEYNTPGDVQGKELFGPYKDINGLPFPTAITYNLDTVRRSLTFSDISVEWAAK